MSDLAKIDVYFSVYGFQEEDVRGKTVLTYLERVLL